MKGVTMKQIEIKVTDNGKMTVECSGQMEFEDFLQMTISGILATAEAFTKHAPEDKQEELRGLVYDSMNMAFARLLDTYLPPTEAQLDEQAIYSAQKAHIAESIRKNTPLRELHTPQTVPQFQKPNRAQRRSGGHNGKLS